MKKGLFILSITLNTIVSSFFSFIFLIGSALNGSGISSFNQTVVNINNYLFIGSLILFVLSFFLNNKIRILFGVILIFFSGLYLMPYFTHTVNEYFLIPPIFYFINSLLLFFVKIK